jgi:phosphatidylserine/phosphatidylglycerophosphate/cardiolipin synthase-like enzyme
MPLGEEIGMAGATRLSIAIACLLALAGCERKAQPQSQPGIAVDQAAIQVYFSPGGGTTAAVVKTLDQAKKTIRVQAYSFTSAPIAEALRDAHRRGVDVQVILDKSQPNQRYTSAVFLANAKIPVFIDRKHAIQHNKVMVIDESIVITGSFNFTESAEKRNAENLLIIASAEMAKVYAQNWEKCRAHSE